MTNFPILVLVAGIIFIYFLLSIISSAIVEMIISGSKARAKVLEEWLKKTFAEKVGDKTLAHYIMNHLSISALSETDKSPSFIDAKNFAAALIEKIAYDVENPDAVAKDLDGIIEKMKESKVLSKEMQGLFLGYAYQVKDTYTKVAEKTQGEIEMFQKKIETWFDSSMDRLTGTLKQKYIRPLTIVVCAFVTLFLNADSIAISKYLYTNKEAQAKVAMMAYAAPSDKDYQKMVADLETLKSKHSVSADSLKVIEAEIKTASDAMNKARASLPEGLPLGWENCECDGWGWVTKILGLLLTTFAIFMGAPFWFDVLNKISNLRSTGAKPASTTDNKPSEKSK